MKKGLQKFKKSDLHKDADATDIANFLHDFQLMVAGTDKKTKLISMRVPENILSSVKFKAQRSGKKYQSVIVDLMRMWIADK